MYTDAYYETSSPTLLADQPPLPDHEKPETADWGKLRIKLETRLVQLRNWRNSWWEHWAMLAEYILPRRYRWLITQNTMTRGLPVNQNIVDPTGTLAMRICASGLMSGLTSPSRPWFKLRPSLPNFQPDYEASLWLDEVESILYRIMARSNFYDSLAQMYEDIIVFGTAPIIIYEDAEDIIRLYNPCAGEYFLAENSTFRADTLNRQFVLTISQIVSMFGIESTPPELQELWRQKGSSLDMERIVAHSIEPNWAFEDNGKEYGVVPGNFTYREVYWVWGSSSPYPLSIRGFNDCPFIAPRWSVTANDPYGRSPGMDVLPDIMQLQVETKRKAEAIEKQVRPPLLASIEMKNEPSSILPGHITYATSIGADKGMRPIYTVNPQIEHMSQDLLMIQQRIQRGFFNDLFLMISESVAKDRTTAYEIAQKNQEKLQVLGPAIERMQNEAFSKIIQRIIGIVSRKNLLPPMPDSLKNVPINIEYISMLAQAQAASATAGMERLLGIVGSVAGVKPEVLDNVNYDEFVRVYSDYMLVPNRVMNPAEQVEQMRAARAKAQQMAEQAQATVGLSQQLVQGAQTLSQTDVGGGQNALQLMLGRGEGA